MAKPESDRQLSLDDAPVADTAPGIPEDHWCYAFYEHIYMAFDNDDFAHIYEEGGRQPISPRFLACLTILQYIFRVSDHRAEEATRMWRHWRIALGVDTKQYTGFHPTVLTKFRQRLKEHGRQRELFEAILDILREHGILKDRRTVRVDLTHLLADVSRRSRVDGITEGMRLVICELAENYPELLENTAFRTLHDEYRDAGWLGISSDDDEVFTKLGRDAKTLLKLCEGRDVEKKEVLEQIVDDNFAFGDDGEPDPNGSDTPPKDRMTTPHDPDAGMGRKGNKTWIGNKVHVVETADTDRPNFITDILVTDPCEGDCDALEAIAQRTAFRLSDPACMIADGGYYTVLNSKRVNELGMEFISRAPRENPKNAIPTSEFDIDFDKELATCPKGCKSISWRIRQRDAGEVICIQFSRTDCRKCEFWGTCVSQGKNGRCLEISVHYERLVEDREKTSKPWFTDLYRTRAGVEGTISQLARTCAMRRSRYPAEEGRTLHAVLAATALNVKRALPHPGNESASDDATPPAAAAVVDKPLQQDEASTLCDAA